MLSYDKKVEIIDFDGLTLQQKCDWVRLHQECFGSTKNVALRLLKKYTLNDGIFCLVYRDQKLAASYSGLKVKYKAKEDFFLSTDTMSNGKILGGSVIAARSLYEYLSNNGIKVVCGYPNKKIEGLRVKRLGWKFSTILNLYIMPSFCIPKYEQKDLVLRRPSSGFFIKDLPFVTIGRHSKRFSILRLELSNKKPHRFCIDLSSLLGIGQKRFYYRKLDESFCDKDFKLGRLNLTSDSIDVP